MTTSRSQQASTSSSSSNGACGSSLPPWRLFLQMLNWRHNPDIEKPDQRLQAANEAAEERILASEERVRADRERERAALRAQQQARCNRVQLCHQLDPSEANAQRVRDVISLLDEYGGLA